MTKLGMKRQSPKKPMKSKPPKDRPLDEAWSLIIRGRVGNKCELCGETNKRLHAHHWVGRRYKATRWLLDNGICLCHQCHQDIHDLPGFKHDVIKKKLGYDRLEELELIALRREKQDKEAIKQNLKEKLKELEHGS